MGFFIFTEGGNGDACVEAAADSCSDPNAACVGGTCLCNDGFFDNEGTCAAGICADKV